MKMAQGTRPQWAVGSLLLIASVLCLASPDSLLAGILQSYAVQLLAFAGVTLLAAMMMERKILATFCGLSSVLLFIFLLPLIGQYVMPSQQGEAQLKVAHFNVLQENPDHDKLICRALSTDADFLSFQEIDETWADSLNDLLPESYPYSRIIPQGENFGLAVFSKFPLLELSEKSFNGLPGLTGKVCMPNGCIGFVASHSPNSGLSRNAHLHQIQQCLSEIEGPKIAVGDYNIVPWSAQIDTFQLKTRMLDSRQGLATIFPSWAGPDQVPLNYIFHSEELNCIGFSTLDSTNSDHLGILGLYKWRDES